MSHRNNTNIKNPTLTTYNNLIHIAKNYIARTLAFSYTFKKKKKSLTFMNYNQQSITPPQKFYNQNIHFIIR